MKQLRWLLWDGDAFTWALDRLDRLIGRHSRDIAAAVIGVAIGVPVGVLAWWSVYRW